MSASENPNRKLKELDEQIRFLTDLRKKITDYQNVWKNKPETPDLSQAEICKLIARVEIPDDTT